MATKTLNLAFKAPQAIANNLKSFTLEDLHEMEITPKARVLISKKGNPFIILIKDDEQVPCFLTFKKRVELFTSLGIDHEVETKETPILDAKGKAVKDAAGKPTKNTQITGVVCDDVDAARIKVQAAKVNLKGSEVSFYLQTGADGEFLLVGNNANGELEDMED